MDNPPSCAANECESGATYTHARRTHTHTDVQHMLAIYELAVTDKQPLSGNTCRI